MKIWDALRGFSGSGKKRRARREGSSHTRHKRNETLGSLKSRGLQMEQFEERMLLSITPATSDLDSSGAVSWLSNHTYMSDAVVSAVERVTNLDYYSVEQLASVEQWVVGLGSANSASLTAAGLGASYISAAPYLEKLSIWEFSSDEYTWETVADTLGTAEGVDFFYPLVPREVESMLIPNDELFDNQWHLQNTGHLFATWQARQTCSQKQLP